MHGDDRPADLPMAQDDDMQDDTLRVGQYVALTDTDDGNDRKFIVAKVTSITDAGATLHHHATTRKSIKSAKWVPVGQLYRICRPLLFCLCLCYRIPPETQGTKSLRNPHPTPTPTWEPKSHPNPKVQKVPGNQPHPNPKVRKVH